MGARFDYPIGYGEPTTETDFTALDDAPTEAELADDARSDHYQTALARLTDEQLLDELGCAMVPLVLMIRRGVADEKIGRIVRMCMHRLVEIEAADLAGDEDELDRLTRDDTEMRELLAELGLGPRRAVPAVALASGVAA